MRVCLHTDSRSASSYDDADMPGVRRTGCGFASQAFGAYVMRDVAVVVRR
ncbi:hypothetical protein BIFBIF_02044 [Bifidobacterium bifidum ATCC 29521 = JCM 1255 = DSM 20456]|nr:hypothetical protein BIFBIF_02044 [Bifidobacterium bifidum ATCC 29521 = JCM 1255 = DSM 20456]